MTLNQSQRRLLWKLLRTGPPEKVERVIDRLAPAELSEVLEHAGPTEHAALMERLLAPERVGTTLRNLPPEVARPHLERCSDRLLGKRIADLTIDDAFDVLDVLPAARQQAVLERLPEELSRGLAKLRTYPESSVGRLMSSIPFTLSAEATVGEAMEELRARAGRSSEPAIYFYVVDDAGRLQGVISPRAMLRAQPDSTVGEIAEPDPIALSVMDDGPQAAQIVARHGLLALPVVQEDGRLVGALSMVDAMDVLSDQATADLYGMQGVPSDDSLHASTVLTLRRRLPWMLVNLGTAFAAAAAVGLFEHTIARLAVLAVFMPIVAGMGGNVGTQVLTLVTRAMALGDDAFVSPVRMLARQVGVSALIGLLVGALAATIAWVVKGDGKLALVLMAAMASSLACAGLVGAAVPLVLRGLRLDPALGSGVVVTTFTDVIGFLTFLGLATLVLG